MVTQREVKAFDESLCSVVFDCGRFDFDVIAHEEFLEFFTDEFSTVLVSYPDDNGKANFC